MEKPVVDDLVLWMLLISIAVICILLFYNGVIGFVNLPGLQESPGKTAFAITGYLLVLLVPLMIVVLIFESAYISRIIELSTTFLLIAVVVDIVLLTVLRLLFY